MVAYSGSLVKVESFGCYVTDDLVDVEDSQDTRLVEAVGDSVAEVVSRLLSGVQVPSGDWSVQGTFVALKVGEDTRLELRVLPTSDDLMLLLFEDADTFNTEVLAALN